jgi:hypothetical protein
MGNNPRYIHTRHRPGHPLRRPADRRTPIRDYSLLYILLAASGAMGGKRLCGSSPLNARSRRLGTRQERRNHEQREMSKQAAPITGNRRPYFQYANWSRLSGQVSLRCIFLCLWEPIHSVCTEFPVHLRIHHQVLPAVAGPDIPNRSPRKPSATSRNQMRIFTLGMKQVVTADFRAPTGVARALARKVRGANSA